MIVGRRTHFPGSPHMLAAPCMCRRWESVVAVEGACLCFVVRSELVLETRD